MAVVEGAHPPQPAQHVRQVAAEDAPVGVQLVDDDVAEVGEQLHPAGVMGQHPGVQHVRVGDHDVAGLTNRLASADRCVAVIGVGLEVDLHLADEAVQLGQLVLGQRFGGKQIQGACFRIAEHRLEDGQVVAGGLAGGRRGDNHQVFAGQCETGRLRLMGVQPGDAAGRQRLPQPQVEALREARVASLASRHRVIEG